MYSLSGYWIGEATGTNNVGIVLTLEQSEDRLAGTAKMSEPYLGVFQFLVSGELKEQISLVLSPTNSPFGIDLGRVTIVGRLTGENELSGRWLTEIGAEGIVKLNRVDPDAIQLQLPKSNSVFIVHGHDEGARHSVARFLEKLGVKPVILQEQLNCGMTVIEKFEDLAARAGFAVILATSDDYGYPKDKEKAKQPRARQNVILELGYFAAKLGRQRIVVLTKGNVELTSDILGLVYEPMDASEGWKLRLARELKAAGFTVDLNNAIT